MMDVVVDVNWTGEDEPALLEDQTAGSYSPPISEVQEMDVLYLFDEWDPENENGGIREAGDKQASVSDPAGPVLSKGPEQDSDDANSFSEG